MLERMKSKYLAIIALNALNLAVALEAYVDVQSYCLLSLVKFHARMAWEYALLIEPYVKTLKS